MDDLLNNSRFFWGLTSVIFNIGMKSVYEDLGVVHRRILDTRVFKLLVIYCMFFAAARDVKVALLLTLAYGLFLAALHEKSAACILPGPIRRHIEQFMPSDAQYAEAKKIVTQYEAGSRM
jgi:hypothetical protein